MTKKLRDVVKTKGLAAVNRAKESQVGKGRSWSDRASSRVYREQYQHVLKRFGKEAADKANYGRGVGGDEHYVSINTRVYTPKGHVHLDSSQNRGDKEAYHEWEDGWTHEQH